MYNVPGAQAWREMILLFLVTNNNTKQTQQSSCTAIIKDQKVINLRGSEREAWEELEGMEGCGNINTILMKVSKNLRNNLRNI